MRKYWSDSEVERFEEAWKRYAADGLSIEHEHVVEYLDVVDLNATGDQALVAYRYRDESYLADSSGEEVRTLKTIDVDMQLTVEKLADGTWTILRSIAAKDAYR